MAELPRIGGAATLWSAYGVLLLPLFSFLINGLWLGRKSARASAWTATLLLGATLCLALRVAAEYASTVLFNADWSRGSMAVVFENTWMNFSAGAQPGLAARLGFFLDPFSVAMLLIVPFISFLVHAYSIGYMKGDPGAGRFFPLLAFFTFSMLGLVVSGNLVQTFFFWELVGAASYLLIGFWYTKPAAVVASKKAFILTRFADAFFLIGLLAVGLTAGSFDFFRLNAPAAAEALNHSIGAGGFRFNLLTWGTLAIYMGAWGKSALFPFHVWLPDAMEGPTPVSSLIHSATMVVAGIYLTARLFPLFSAAEYTLRVVEFSGAFTAVFAAAIACTQMDLKRILAFSTLSQLGLMMLSLGVGGHGYQASLFHIFTHAFFKCLLFLSAGMVIHAIHGNDVRDAAKGGAVSLAKRLPYTYAATLIAILAITGLWPFSGFFSKEAILHAALANGRSGAFLAGLCTSGLTAFYMSRYFFLVFHGGRPAGAPRTDGHADSAHEGLWMLLPILILAVPSALAGIVCRGVFADFPPPWIGSSGGAGGHAGTGIPAEAAHAAAGSNGSWLPIAATSLALAGLALGWYWYGLKKHAPGFPGRKPPVWYRILADKFYIDAIYLFLAKRVGGHWIAAPIAWAERNLVNGAFDRVTGAIRRLARAQSLAQSGQLQWYIGAALLGLFLLAHFAGLGS